jgi:hypothetical protein
MLSLREVKQLENYDMPPCCWHHRHITFAEALAGVREFRLRVVGEGTRRVCQADSNQYVWRVRPSGLVKVRQMVPL